jgi:hypothetical protein
LYYSAAKRPCVSSAKPRRGDTSPAVTMKINSISVDIVPAINLLEWPRPAKDWKSKWLAADIKRDVYAVTKIHPSGENSSCLQNIELPTEKILILYMNDFQR